MSDAIKEAAKFIEWVEHHEITDVAPEVRYGYRVVRALLRHIETEARP